MNRDQKMRVAKELFQNTTMTKEQYQEFCKLAEELDLVVADVEDWTTIENNLEKDFKPYYINS